LQFDFSSSSGAGTLSSMPDQPKLSIFRRLHWQAILVGFVVDYAGSVFSATLAGIFIAVFAGGPGDDATGTTQAALNTNMRLLFGLVVGSLFVVIGGFVVGRIARQRYVLNGAALGVVDVLLGLTLHFREFPFWFHASSVVITIPCAMLGAWLAGLVFPNYAPPPSSPPAA